jgi:hypothetical protein
MRNAADDLTWFVLNAEAWTYLDAAAIEACGSCALTWRSAALGLEIGDRR